jgi:hypothetical protein
MLHVAILFGISIFDIDCATTEGWLIFCRRGRRGGAKGWT